MQQFVTPEELAKQLKLNTVTIYRYIRNGNLPAYKIGRTYRIDIVDVESFLCGIRTTGKSVSANGVAAVVGVGVAR
jgi:putative molybdopterin biosynthesis protein